MQESLAPKHGGELLANPSKHLLDGGGVADESGREFQPSGGNVTHAGLHIIGDPFHEVGRVLVLHIDHLFVHLFGAHFAPEHGGSGEVAAVARVGGAHHVLGVPHLLGQFRDRERDVLLGSAGVTILSLLTHNIENGIDQLSAFGVMSLGPVIPRTVLSEDKVIRSEDLAKRSRSNAIHRTRLEIHKDGARHVPATGSLIEIHIDALELEIAGTAAVAALVTAGGVNAVLVADNLPEFGANLIAALASLNV
nr:betatubulin [Ipomoea batatas]